MVVEFSSLIRNFVYIVGFFAFGAAPNATVTKINIALLKIRHGHSEFCVVSKKIKCT